MSIDPDTEPEALRAKVDEFREKFLKLAGSRIPIGGNSKSALSACKSDAEALSTSALQGVVSYEPTEFLVSALAGTTIADLTRELALNRQCLPFDPLFSSEGATLGGTIASGISGPSRLLHGSVRDFVMEVELLDGLGRLVRGGGKVVKNAAGFDLPKMVVGSYGRLGVMTELTLKVLPLAEATATLTATLDAVEQYVECAQRVLALPLPTTRVDLSAKLEMTVQFSGPRNSLQRVLERAENALMRPCQTSIDSAQSPSSARETGLSHPLPGESDACLIRVVVSPAKCARLYSELSSVDKRLKLICVCGGGSEMWLAISDASLMEFTALLKQIDATLHSAELSGVVVRGPVDGLTLLGDKSWIPFATRIQRAMDPDSNFLPFQTAFSN